ncbi:MAG: ferredoxin [Clostridia bacterium]|jgi:NAD-dependent dihydropyrimidine dehydrogenase PreA subunit|nr:ferredoxin [Clostridia bacterium]
MKHKYIRNVTTLELKKDKCKGCGFCVEVCPHRVFVMENGRADIVDKNRCMECGACALNCPFEAITVEVGVGCAIAIINGNNNGGKSCC